MRNKSRYSEHWYDVIRPDILKRDNYKCTKCGVKHRAVGYRNAKGIFIECDKFMLNWCLEQGIKTFKMYLQISHIDHNPANNNYSNLQSLCPKCHLSNDKLIRHLSRISK